MPINAKIKITDSSTKIGNEFLKGIHYQLHSVLQKAAPRMQSRIRQITKSGLEKSETYQSLCDGILQSDFGFEPGEGQDFADGVVNLIINRIDVRITAVQRTTTSIKASIIVGLVPKDYNDLFKSSFAKYKSKPVSGNPGGMVYWLEWLLTAGTQYVIVDHHIVYNVRQDILDVYSRSGEALMYKGGSYAVPAYFSGTKTENWITRVLDKLESDILKIMKEEFINAIP